MSKTDLDKVLSTLKACVLSSVDGVTEDRLNNDYKSLMGINVPWKEMGYQSLSDLIRSSSTLKIESHQGQRLVVAEVNDKAAHMTALINKQKRNSGKKKKVTPKSLSYKVSFRRPDKQPIRRINPSFTQPIYRTPHNFERVTNRQVQTKGNHLGNEEVNGRRSSQQQLNTNLYKYPMNKDTVEVKKIKEQESVKKCSKKTKIPPLLNNTTELLVTLDSKNNNRTVGKLMQNGLPKVQHPVLETTASSSETYKTRSPSHKNPAQMRINHVTSSVVDYPAMQSSLDNNNYKVKSVHFDTPCVDTFIEKLSKLALTNGWSQPEYITLPRIISGNVKVFSCSVNGTYSTNSRENMKQYDFTTMPDEYPDVLKSKEAVAEKAYESLNAELSQKEEQLPVTTDRKTIIKRVWEIVNSFQNGLWVFKVEKDYKQKYNESLPPEWYIELSKCGILTAEKLSDFSYVVVPVPEQHEKVLAALDVRLPDLVIPTSEYWNVYVTKVVSCSEVWLRFVGEDYSGAFDEVMNSMNYYYKTSQHCSLEEIKPNNYYAHLSQYCVSRVKVISKDSSDKVTVFDIDHGDCQETSSLSLCLLNEKFMDLAPQAVKCTLFGMSEFSKSQMANSLLTDRLEGKVLVAERKTSEDPPALVIYDTTGDEELNINCEIALFIENNFFEIPSLREIGSVHNVVIGHVWKSGVVYVMKPTDAFQYIVHRLDCIDDVESQYYLTKESQVQQNHVYLYKKDNSIWVRVTVLPPFREIEGQVDIFYMDSGELNNVKMTELVPADLISHPLSVLPEQAIQVSLDGFDEVKQQVVAVQDRLVELLTPNSSAVVKVISVDRIPSVKLYSVEPNTQALISINTTLLVQAAEAVPNSPIEHTPPEFPVMKRPVDKTLLVPASSYRLITEVTIPECGEKFDVYVVNVSNPSSFNVIPLKFVKDLTNLQDEMSKFYNLASETEYEIKCFNVNQPCAVKNQGSWYRAILKDVSRVALNQLIVTYCDFGNMNLVSKENVRVLGSQFFTLPGLAIHCKLHGIKPKHGDWQIQDCTRISDLLHEKKLESTIMDRVIEDGATRLSLELYDPHRTVPNISQLLIQEFRALPV